MVNVRESLDQTGVVIESLAITERPIKEGRLLSLFIPKSDLPDFIERLNEATNENTIED